MQLERTMYVNLIKHSAAAAAIIKKFEFATTNQ